MTMRAILILLLSAAFASALTCDDKPGRYTKPNIFASVKQTSNIQFGSAKNPLHNNATETLSADVFQPVGDTCTKRPLVIFMWGGGFQGGQRQDETGDCQNFAKRGFVCATSDYRKGNSGPYSIPNFCGPTFMSTQDTRASIRFFKKNAAQYGIDTAQIFVGGCSSGAYAAMHTGYLDEESEIPNYLSAAITAGGIEGNSGNPGYGSRPAGVLSLSGGLFDSTWVKPGSVPAAMVGCTQDPYESMDSLGQNGSPPFFISDFDYQRLGPRFKRTGVPLVVKSVTGVCHCPHPSDGTVGDQSIDFLAKSAYGFMTAPPVTRIAVALDAPRPAEGAVWFDLSGRRVAPKGKGAWRPGIYLHRAEESPSGAKAGR